MDRKNVYLFVFDGLSDWEAGYAVAGINQPALQRAPERYRVRTAAMSRQSILTMGGVRILPEVALEEISPADSAVLILPGGAAWDRGKNGEAVEHAAAFLAAGVPVAAICGATAGLARGGLLDSRRHTSNSPEYLAATGYRGGALYEAAPAVTDGNVITAPGTSPVDFALHIFRVLDLYSPPVAEAWHGLFKTGRPEYYEAMMAAARE